MHFKLKGAPPTEELSVQALARQLGVERRQNVRVRYPKRTTGPLPSVSHDGSFFRVEDISVGGCCLYDPTAKLGENIGREVQLILTWQNEDSDLVSCRIVGTSSQNRHIQFLDLPQERVEELRRLLLSGICGLALNPVFTPPSTSGPVLEAAEVWNSLAGDSLVLSSEAHKIAELNFAGRTFRLFREAWPTGAMGEVLKLEEIRDILLFLANIPRPSPQVVILLSSLEKMILEGPR